MGIGGVGGPSGVKWRQLYLNKLYYIYMAYICICIYVYIYVHNMKMLMQRKYLEKKSDNFSIKGFSCSLHCTFLQEYFQFLSRKIHFYSAWYTTFYLLYTLTPF